LIVLENKKQNLGTRDGKTIVPTTTSDGTIFMRTALIREAHEPPVFAHGGQNKTIYLLKQDYWWEGMTKDIKRYIKNCQKCGRNKTRHDKTPGLLHPLLVPNHVWEQVAVNGKDIRSRGNLPNTGLSERPL
jgi:hypothetical protein